MTTVYVITGGEYEDYEVKGVYASLESAMASTPGEWEQLPDWVDDAWVPGSTSWGHVDLELIIEAYELQG